MWRQGTRSRRGAVLILTLMALLPLAAHSFQTAGPHRGRRHARRKPAPVTDSVPESTATVEGRGGSLQSAKAWSELPPVSGPPAPQASDATVARNAAGIFGPPPSAALRTKEAMRQARARHHIAPVAPVEEARQSLTPIIGPPICSERIANREQADRLLAAYRSGRLVLTVPEREEAQLNALAQDGLYCWPAPPRSVPVRSPRQRELLLGTALPDSRLDRPDGETLASRATSPGARMRSAGDPGASPDFDPQLKPPSSVLLRTLAALAAHSTPERPLELMSLLRPLYRVGSFVHVGPNNPHSLGLAADIAAYGGWRILQDHPEACVAATLALLRDLPPGRYRLGLPKAPDFPLVVGRPPLPPLLLNWLWAPSSAPLVASTGSSRLTVGAVTGETTASPGSPLSRTPSRTGASSRRVFVSGAAPLPERLSQTAERSAAWLSPLLVSAPPSADANPLQGLLPPSAAVPARPQADASIRPGCMIAAAIGATLDVWAGTWPFFPAPQPLLEGDLVAPVRVNGRPVRDAVGRLVPAIARFRNEDYADPEDLADRRLQQALLAAQRRGVEIVALFPDGADHIHVDVRQSK